MKKLKTIFHDNKFMLMAIVLRGYSLYNCLEIQYALVGKPTGITFTIILEITAIVILLLLANQKGLIFFLTMLFYIAISFFLVMLNDASLTLKMRQQSQAYEKDLRQTFEIMRQIKVSQIDLAIDLRQKEIDENDLLIDRGVSKDRKIFLEKRTKRHIAKIKELAGEKNAISAIMTDNVRDINITISRWLPDIEISRDFRLPDSLLRQNGTLPDLALNESWGINGVKAKKLLFLIMAILVEVLIFIFAILPGLLKKVVSKNETLSQDSETIIDEIETIKIVPQDRNDIEKLSQNNGKVKIETIGDLRHDMIRRFKKTGKHPAGNNWNKKWLNDYKRLRIELWPEKYGGDKCNQ